MNTPHDNPGTGPRDDAALTPEERELAEQIARAAPQRGPSPALDASILRAARVAVAAPHPTEASTAAAAMRATSTRRRAQRRRWPAVFGVAATLALAFGLAWQLRPVDEVRVMTAEAPSIPPPAQTGSGGPSAEDESALVIQERAAATPAQAADAVSAPEVPADTAQAKAIQQTAPRAQDEAEVKQVFAREPVPDVGSTAPIAPAPAAPPPPPQEQPVFVAPPPEPPAGILPAAPAAAEPAPQAASDQYQYRIQERRAPAPVPAPGAMAAPAPAPAVSGNAASGVVMPAPSSGYSSGENQQRQKQESEKRTELDKIEVTGSRIQSFEDQPIDDEPPASADSPEVREAWLKRVRELVTHGDRDAARDSLREYRRRYPDAVIPDDLRPLLSE
jgi:hypothetical protein